MPAEYDFTKELRFSQGRRADTDQETIMQWVTGAERIEIAGIDQERLGIDYVVTLRGGSKVHIDGKARKRGCAHFWRCALSRQKATDCRCFACADGAEPELALEVWSVLPRSEAIERRLPWHADNRPEGVVGWTLHEGKATDGVLFTFDPADTPLCYLLPFQHLRIAFRRNHRRWLAEWGPYAVQKTSPRNGRGWYYSQCLFVPASEVLRAVTLVMEGQYRDGQGFLFAS